MLKRQFLLISVLLVLSVLIGVIPALAQDTATPITLNDATPAIDVVIDLPANSTGTVSVSLQQASATLRDANNVAVFRAADPRLHGLELNIAPNSGTHTLTIDRLPGFSQAVVSVTSLPDMTINGTVHLVQGDTISLNEELALPLDAATPGDSVTINVPADTTALVTTTFPGASAATRLEDSDGVLIAQSAGGHIDGMTFVLDAGEYTFSVVGSNLTDMLIADVRAVSVDVSGFTLLDIPPTQSAVVANEPAAACTATVLDSTQGLRSGPGTGYSVLGYASRGSVFLVGGENTEQNWVVVGTNRGSAWMEISVSQLQGDCSQLTIYDIPLRGDSSSQSMTTAPNNNTNTGYENEHENEHEGSEHEGSEHDD